MEPSAVDALTWYTERGLSVSRLKETPHFSISGTTSPGYSAAIARRTRTIAGHVRTIFCRWSFDAPSFEAIACMDLTSAHHGPKSFAE